ncbi:MAG: hypothetical protein P8H93_04530 [Polaribacter sp.]|nr:hypothetical protein [Polaribacter sp.]
MKKKTRNAILILIGVLVALFAFRTIYRNYNFEKDNQFLLELKSKAGAGEVTSVLDKMEEIESLSNPIINSEYQKWKKKMYARFVSKNEKIENTSGYKIINDISTIYRNYWRTELLKENPENRTDTLLYSLITDYLVSNHLTKLTKDSLFKTIKNDSELKRIIEGEGFKADFKYRNGFQEVFIWDKETIDTYEVTLPKDTINATVVFIENYHLNGYDNYASMGSSQVGGWALKESATLYCNKSDYDLTSEKFKVSYLKHESLHFTDLNEYPNLSSADLEYRAKIIELMYCTEKTMYEIILQFLNGANSADRNHSHPYANFILIKNLSKSLFNLEYESDYTNWKKTPVEDINNAAASLYKKSEERLQNNNSLTKII